MDHITGRFKRGGPELHDGKAKKPCPDQGGPTHTSAVNLCLHALQHLISSDLQGISDVQLLTAVANKAAEVQQLVCQRLKAVEQKLKERPGQQQKQREQQNSRSATAAGAGARNGSAASHQQRPGTPAFFEDKQPFTFKAVAGAAADQAAAAHKPSSRNANNVSVAAHSNAGAGGKGQRPASTPAADESLVPQQQQPRHPQQQQQQHLQQQQPRQRQQQQPQSVAGQIARENLAHQIQVITGIHPARVAAPAGNRPSSSSGRSSSDSDSSSSSSSSSDSDTSSSSSDTDSGSSSDEDDGSSPAAAAMDSAEQQAVPEPQQQQQQQCLVCQQLVAATSMVSNKLTAACRVCVAGAVQGGVTRLAHCPKKGCGASDVRLGPGGRHTGSNGPPHHVEVDAKSASFVVRYKKKGRKKVAAQQKRKSNKK